MKSLSGDWAPPALFPTSAKREGLFGSFPGSRERGEQGELRESLRSPSPQPLPTARLAKCLIPRPFSSRSGGMLSQPGCGWEPVGRENSRCFQRRCRERGACGSRTAGAGRAHPGEVPEGTNTSGQGANTPGQGGKHTSEPRQPSCDNISTGRHSGVPGSPRLLLSEPPSPGEGGPAPALRAWPQNCATAQHPGAPKCS